MNHWRFVALTSAVVLTAISSAQTPQELLDRLTTRVDTLLKTEQPPLYAWHLRSLKALAQSEATKLALNIPQAGHQPVALREKEFLDYLKVIAQGLEDAKPDDYLKGGRGTLILARPSRLDGTLQYFMVDLPEGWDPARPYPLFIGLHGTGPDNPLAYPSFAMAPKGPAPNRDMIRLTPWGRGNRSWRGDGETDLFEAIGQLQTFAKTDPDRWYLTGHSAGADGAWAILQHTPDLWAAVGLQSGSMLWGRPEWGLMENMRHVPVHILIGEQDNLFARIPDSKDAHERIVKMGGKSRLVILPGVGHYPLTPESLAEQTTWMTGFVRQRPAKFSFTIDQPIHPGIWGIRSTVDPYQRRFLKEPWGRFDCEIKGQEVRIKTQRIPELSIDLGSNGLKMTGEAKLFVNGKEVHKGPIPAKPIVVKT